MGHGKGQHGVKPERQFCLFHDRMQECRGQDWSLVFSGNDSFESGGPVKEKKQNCVFPGNSRHCCYVQLSLSRLYLEASRGRFVPIRSVVVFESLQVYLLAELLLFLEPCPKEYVGRDVTDFKYECSA